MQHHQQVKKQESATGAASSSSFDGKAYLEHLKKVNDVFYDQIKIADQKAAYLFTFMIAFLVTSVDGSSAFSSARYLTDPWAPAIASAVLAVAVTTTLISAIMVVLPRSASGGSSLYWASWQENRAGLVEATLRSDPDFLTREYLKNVDNLSAIARDKFFFVGVAFRGLLVVVVSYVVLLVVK